MGTLSDLWNSLDFSAMLSALMRLIAVFLCLTVHETCHGLAAYALGDPTAKREHRLSLNPLHHIDWVGLACMLVLGFGWAKPVPVDMRYFKKPKQGMALTALAGPVSNFVLALLALLCARLVYHQYGALWDFIFDLLLTTAYLSVGLGLFNLIPISPLDGSKVLFAFLPDSAYEKLMRYEKYGMIALLILVWLGVGDNVLSTAIYNECVRCYDQFRFPRHCLSAESERRNEWTTLFLSSRAWCMSARRRRFRILKARSTSSFSCSQKIRSKYRTFPSRSS